MKEPMAMAKVENAMVNVATTQEIIEKEKQVAKWHKNGLRHRNQEKHVILVINPKV